MSENMAAAPSLTEETMRRLLKGFTRSESASPSDSQKTKRSRHHKSRQHRLRHHRHSKYFQNVAIIKGGPRALLLEYIRIRQLSQKVKTNKPLSY